MSVNRAILVVNRAHHIRSGIVLHERSLSANVGFDPRTTSDVALLKGGSLLWTMVAVTNDSQLAFHQKESVEGVSETLVRPEINRAGHRLGLAGVSRASEMAR